MNGAHPYETVPRPLEDVVDNDNLREIRTRRDSLLAVGLYLNPEAGKLVLAFAGVERKPFAFEVSRDDANQAFDEPWSYAPDAGKMALCEILAVAKH